MKRFAAGFLGGLVVCFILFRTFSPVSEPTYNEDRLLDEEVATYNKAYEAGYEAGYNKGLANAPEMVEYQFKRTLSAICWYMNEVHEIYPSEAMNIIMQYADGETIEHDELITALWVAWEYYIEVHDCIEDIDAYELD